MPYLYMAKKIYIAMIYTSNKAKIAQQENKLSKIYLLIKPH